MSDLDQWLRDRINFHSIRLGILLTMDSDARVLCPRCGGDPVSAARADLCGCKGTMSVADAIEHHRAELGHLSTPSEAA